MRPAAPNASPPWCASRPGITHRDACCPLSNVIVLVAHARRLGRFAPRAVVVGINRRPRLFRLVREGQIVTSTNIVSIAARRLGRLIIPWTSRFPLKSKSPCLRNCSILCNRTAEPSFGMHRSSKRIFRSAELSFGVHVSDLTPRNALPIFPPSGVLHTYVPIMRQRDRAKTWNPGI